MKPRHGCGNVSIVLWTIFVRPGAEDGDKCDADEDKMQAGRQSEIRLRFDVEIDFS